MIAMGGTEKGRKLRINLSTCQVISEVYVVLVDLNLRAKNIGLK